MSYIALHHPRGDEINAKCRRFLLQVHQPISHEEFRRAVHQVMTEYEPFKHWFMTTRNDLYRTVATQLFAHGEAPDECSICCDQPQYVFRLKQCQHAFHIHCFTKWLARGSQTCPCCRAPINIVL